MLDDATNPTRRGKLLTILALLFLGVFLAWNAYQMSDELIGNIKLANSLDHTFGGGDFPAFYGGARLFVADPANAYDEQSQARFILDAKGIDPSRSEEDSPWYRYYNPPVYSLLLAPLTQLELHDAYGVTLLVNTVGLALLIFVLWRILSSRPLIFCFLVAAMLSSQPLNYAFWHAQPTLFLAAFLGASYLLLDAGRPRLAGVLTALLLVKPHWLLAPIVTVWPFRKGYLLSFVAVALVMALPFLLIGLDGTRDYIQLVLGRGQGDIASESFAEGVLSWSGFFRGLTAQARPDLALLMIGITLVIYLAIRRRQDLVLTRFAGVITVLVVLPHSHPQDWIMLAPVAAFLFRSQTDAREIAVTTLLLLVIYVGLDHWSGLRDRRNVIYWPTLGAFFLLAWTLLLSEVRYARSRPVTTMKERTPLATGVPVTTTSQGTLV